MVDGVQTVRNVQKTVGLDSVTRTLVGVIPANQATGVTSVSHFVHLNVQTLVKANIFLKCVHRMALIVCVNLINKVSKLGVLG